MLSHRLSGPAMRLRCAKFAPFSSAMVPAAHRNVATRAQSSDRVVKVAHILLNEGQTALADDLEARIAGGAAFEDLAREHSTCGSAKRGGELGWLSRGTFFPQFEAAAFAAPVGGLTRASTGRGLHLIKILEERYQAAVQQLSVQELYDMLSNPVLLQEADPQLVDVREEWEWQTARLPGFQLLPLSAFNDWAPSIATRLDPSRETVVLCHHGVRSMQMSQFLVQNGFIDVKNVRGGIDAYSRVDASVPIY